MTTPSTNLFRAEKATLLIWVVFVAMTFHATAISITSAAANTSNRSLTSNTNIGGLTIWAEVPNPETFLIPGLPVTVDVTIAE